MTDGTHFSAARARRMADPFAALAAPVAMVVAGPRDGSAAILFASQGFIDMFGLHPGDALDPAALARIGCAEPARAMSALRGALAGAGDDRRVAFDSRPACLRIAPATRDDGTPAALVESVPSDDIPQSRVETLTEAQIARVLGGHVGDGAILADPEGHAVWISPSAGRLLGLARNAAQGRTLSDLLLVRRSDAAAKAALEDGIVRGAAFEIDLPALRAAGRVLWLRARCVPVTNAAADTIGVAVMLDDRTALRAAERHASALRGALDFALAGVRAVLWDADPAAGTIRTHGETEPLLGAAPPALIEPWVAWLLDNTCPGDRADLSGRLRAHFDHGAPVDTTIRAAAGPRGWRWLRLRAEMRGTGSGDTARSVGLVQDVSAMRDASSDAERVERQKTELVSNVTHELRDTLNGVAGSAQLLSLMDLDPRQKVLAERIVTGCQSIQSLVDDTLDLARIQAGLLKLHDTAFSPAALCREVAGAHRAAAETAGLRLDLDLQIQPQARCVGDARRLRQILEAFMSNAVRFTRRGGVSLRAERLATGELRFAVTDSGPGIPEAIRPGIFRRYGAVEVTADAVSGAGLGLSIAGDLAHILKGRIGVDSSPGHGATFWITVPFPERG